MRLLPPGTLPAGVVAGGVPGDGRWPGGGLGGSGDTPIGLSTEFYGGR